MIRPVITKFKKPLDEDKIYIYEKTFMQSDNLIILKKKGDIYLYVDKYGVSYQLDRSVYLQYILDANEKSTPILKSGTYIYPSMAEYKLYECDSEKDVDNFKLSKELLR